MRSKTQREKQARHVTPVVKDAADRIRAVEGNRECADCSAPSKPMHQIIEFSKFFSVIFLHSTLVANVFTP